MNFNEVILPTYKCHKLVKAAKIKEIAPVVTHAPKEGEEFGLILVEGIEHSDQLVHFVSKDWIDKHGAKAGGYLVVYEDGYTSFSPAKAFEAGYTLQ